MLQPTPNLIQLLGSMGSLGSPFQPFNKASAGLTAPIPFEGGMPGFPKVPGMPPGGFPGGMSADRMPYMKDAMMQAVLGPLSQPGFGVPPLPGAAPGGPGPGRPPTSPPMNPTMPGPPARRVFGGGGGGGGTKRPRYLPV